jgi:hypothetical protein
MANGKLELVFVDKEGKWYPLDEVDREDLAAGLEKKTKKIGKRLQFLKEKKKYFLKLKLKMFGGGLEQKAVET